MISRNAVKDFRTRELDNWRVVKTWSEDKLDRMLAKLNPVPKFRTPLRDYQKACFLLGVKHPGFLFLLDMGLGKTLIMLSLFRWRMRKSPGMRCLVLVPNSINTNEWAEQCAIHTPKLRAAALAQGVPKEEREAMVDGEADLVVMTYAGMLHLVCDRVRGDGMKLNQRKVRDFARNFGMIVADESTCIRNHQSLFFRACSAMRKHVKYRYCLSGTPIGRNPEAFWSQFFFVDNGETLGDTLGMFRAAYFKEIPNFWGGVEYELDYRHAPRLKRAVLHKSIRYKAEECLSLPPLVMQQVRVQFPAETWEYYARLREDMKESKGNFQEVEAVYHRMRQLASGWLPYKDKGAKKHITFAHNPKLEALIEKISETPPGRKAIIFYQYDVSGGLIIEALKKAKIKYVHISGKTGKKAESLERFKNDPKVTFMVLNNWSGAFGLNLQVANYMHFFEAPDDSIIRKQALRRSHRGGQTRTCFCYDYIVKKSIDERIYASLARGASLFEELVEQRNAR